MTPGYSSWWPICIPSLASTGRKGLKEPKEASLPGQLEDTASYKPMLMATSTWALLVFHVNEVGLGTGSGPLAPIQ